MSYLEINYVIILYKIQKVGEKFCAEETESKVAITWIVSNVQNPQILDKHPEFPIFSDFHNSGPEIPTKILIANS